MSEAVYCRDCARFTADVRNPAQGMGRCDVEAWKRSLHFRDLRPGGWPPYPDVERICRPFQRIDGAVEAAA